MPKVSEEYFEKKKQAIVDAAYRVCLRKPVEMITMMDVIEETGLSQGGIYRFYKDLDEILSDVIAGMRKNVSIVDEVEQLFSAKEELDFEEGVHKILDILADVMEKHLMDIQKINFDLTVLAINEPDRAAAIIKGTKGRGNFEYLAGVVMPMLVEACGKNDLKPLADPVDILKYISASYVGIEMNCILSACYGNGIMNVDAKPKELFKVLAKTIILLFGGKID